MARVGARALVLEDGDSVAVAAAKLVAGEVEAWCGASCLRVLAAEPIAAGHKLALRDIARGEAVLKYGLPIGMATRDIAAGSWVHEHNLGSGLLATSSYGELEGPYVWAGRARAEALLARLPSSFRGYRRPDGSVGTRNELWIVPTVGCINGHARALAALAREQFGLDAQALEHPNGCSQLGCAPGGNVGVPAGDLDATRRILARLALHPNAAATLVLSLGCENNTLAELKAEMGSFDRKRVAFLAMQEAGDEMAEARALLQGLAAYANSQGRVELPLSELSLGLKCGGSDGFSGLTANPLVGRLCDLVVAAGGRALMTEVPEMFGAEAGLLSRCASPRVFEACASMLQSFKDYYATRGQEVYENPSPGNREGGITTLEEKSLGCVRKSGTAPVSGILPYAQGAIEHGLSLVTGPGNDLVSSTSLAAAGAQVLLFTTGRGTPFGSLVPTMKISSNSRLAAHKPHWIDFDAGRILEGEPFDELALELMREVIAVAGGKTTRAEAGGHRGLAIFKDGVTL